MIDNTQLEKIFAYYKINVAVAGSSENLFYSVYDLIPGENVTISKIKRILPDVQTWVKGSCVLDIENGIKLKIEHEKRPMLFSYDFTKEISEDARPEVLPLIIGEDEAGKRIFYDLVKSVLSASSLSSDPITQIFPVTSGLPLRTSDSSGT